MATGETQTKAPPTRLGPMLLAIGPGIVVSGSVIGSGELINVPVQAATFGFVLFWAVILSCVIKFFLQVELGRYCLVHNRTTIQALNTCPGPKIRGTSWIGLVYMVGYTASVVTVGGIMASTAGLFTSVLPLAGSEVASTNLWALIVFVVIGLILWRGIYGELEKLIAILVCGFSISVVVALLLLVVKPDERYPISMIDVISGCTLSLGDLAPAAAAVAVVSLLGALGTTANEMFMYPYWVLEKGYAANVGSAGSDGWLDRAQGWVRVLRLDAGVATLLATVITAAYFLVGSAVFSTDLLTVNPDGGSPDILDGKWKTICVQLHEAAESDSASPVRRVWELLPDDRTRAMLIAVAESDQLDQQADAASLNALNAIIGNHDFYQAASFRTLTDPADGAPQLPGQAQDLLARVQAGGMASLSEREVQRLNRQLLDASFPEAIVPTVPSGMSIVHQLSRIYTDTYGAWSYSIFMFGGFCTLFSTIVVVVAASGRMWTDLLSSLGVFKYEDEPLRRRYNRVFQTLYLLAFLAITWFIPGKPVLLVIMGQTINGAFNTPILMFGIVWLAFHTDRRLRMNKVTAVLLLVSVVVIVGCLAIGLVRQVGH